MISILNWGKVRITVCSDISSTIVLNFIFNASMVQKLKNLGIHDTMLRSMVTKIKKKVLKSLIKLYAIIGIVYWRKALRKRY